MLDRAVQLFALGGPLHRRRAYILTHLHQRIHEAARQLLILQRRAQLVPRHVTAGIHTRSHAAKSILLHDVTLAPRLLQQQHIRDRPDKTMPSQIMHACSTPETKKMLSPHARPHGAQLRSRVVSHIIIETTDTQWKLKRVRTLQTTWVTIARRILIDLVPAVHRFRRLRSRSSQVLGHLTRFLIQVCAASVALEGAAATKICRLFLNDTKLQPHVL